MSVLASVPSRVAPVFSMDRGGGGDGEGEDGAMRKSY